jgi:Tfp pilus assembly protein PilX
MNKRAHHTILPVQDGRRRQRCRRRGAVYVLVLSVAVLVTLIGMSALAVARLQLRTVKYDEQAMDARINIRSAAEVILHRIANNPNWRTTYTNNVWTSYEAILGNYVAFGFLDETDNDLTDDPEDPVRLYVQSIRGGTVRVASVLLKPGKNLLANGNAEQGADSWTGMGGCNVASDNSPVHGGAASIAVTSRSGAASGPHQAIDMQIESGKTYYIEAWIRPGLLDPMAAQIKVDSSGSGQQTFIGSYQSTILGWKRYTTLLTPTWTGDLNSAYVSIRSQGLLPFDFNIDDVVMCETTGTGRPMVPVPGTWRQEVF